MSDITTAEALEEEQIENNRLRDELAGANDLRRYYKASYVWSKKRVEELENNIKIMVVKAAEKSLDGYRELGARAAAAETRVEELEKQKEITIGAVIDLARQVEDLKTLNRALNSAADANLALVEELKDYKSRYPPDFIEKLQQTIDEWQCGMHGHHITDARMYKALQFFSLLHIAENNV